MMSKKIAFYLSTFLSLLATIVVTPYSVGWVHQPKVPKELYRK